LKPKDQVQGERERKFMHDSRTIGQGVVVGQAGAEALLEKNKQNYAEQTVLSNAFTIRFPPAPAAAYVDALFASAGVTPTAAERRGHQRIRDRRQHRSDCGFAVGDGLGFSALSQRRGFHLCWLSTLVICVAIQLTHRT
jgi:hypothetical protein